MTETDLMPNPVVGNSERAGGKSKKRESFRKPNTEPPPNRISEIATGVAALSTAGVIAVAFPNVGFECDPQESIENGHL